MNFKLKTQKGIWIVTTFLVVEAMVLSGCGSSDANWQSDVFADMSALSYDMDLRLDTEKNRLEQTIKMEIINNGSEEADTLYLRYYPNGYVPDLVAAYPDENKGKSASITSIMMEGSEKELSYECGLNNTSIKVNLNDDPIEAGETIILEVNAWTDLPIGLDRFGTTTWDEGKLYHLTFCFPYLEYNHDGKWYLDPPLFSFLENRNPDETDYHVTLQVPENFTVAAPGNVEKNGTVTEIEALDIRDLAIFVSDCMGVDEFELQGVKVKNYYLKMEGEQDYRKFSKQFLADAFENLTEMVGAYGRDSFVLVEGTKNMEYSGIAEVSGKGFYKYDPSRYEDVFDNIVHETGHQWFFDSVGNYEYREGWIDEGFTTYLVSEILNKDTESTRMLKEKYGKSLSGDQHAEKIRQDRELLKKDLEGYDHFDLLYKGKYPLKTFMGNEAEGEELDGQIEYNFAPLFLSEAKEIMGEEKFTAFVKEVYQTYSGKIADTEGILNILQKHDDSKDMQALIRFYFETEK